MSIHKFRDDKIQLITHFCRVAVMVFSTNTLMHYESREYKRNKKSSFGLRKNKFDLTILNLICLQTNIWEMPCYQLEVQVETERGEDKR